VDNVTHALAGVLTAEAAVQWRRRRGIEPDLAWRHAAWMASALAHNLPDADVLYAYVTSGPLGYLLHHRGHTHTLVLAPVFATIAYAFGSWRARARGSAWSSSDRTWMAVLALLGPLGHLALDASNEYGVHPFWPLSNRWFYGDTIFILEPLFWAVAIPCVLFAATSRAPRVLFGGLLVAILALAWATGEVPRPFAAFATSVAIGAMVTAWRMSPGKRIASAVAGSGCVLALFGIAGRAAEARIRARVAVEYPGWRTLDVARFPVPASPTCWHMVVVQREEQGDRYALRVLRASAWPALVPARLCATRVRGIPTAPLVHRDRRDASVEPAGDFVGTRSELRRRATRCDFAAFLRFARTPFYADRSAHDWIAGELRYDSDAALGFGEVALPHDPPTRCPTLVPPWTAPRADLLAP